jgi:hypothetical protein
MNVWPDFDIPVAVNIGKWYGIPSHLPLIGCILGNLSGSSREEGLAGLIAYKTRNKSSLHVCLISLQLFFDLNSGPSTLS